MPITVNVPNTFTNNTTADANQVNENFTALADAIGEAPNAGGDTFTGVMEFGANAIVKATNTASVSQNFPSYEWQFQRSYYSGGQTLTGTSYFGYDSSGVLHWYNESGNPVWQVDQGGTVTLFGHLDLPNDTAVQAKDSGGTYRSLALIDGSDKVQIGDVNKPLNLNSSSAVTASSLTLSSALSAGTISGTTVSATGNISGSTITASGAVQVNQGQSLQSKDTGGTYRSIASVDASNNLNLGNTAQPLVLHSSGSTTVDGNLALTAGHFDSNGNWIANSGLASGATVGITDTNGKQVFTADVGGDELLKGAFGTMVQAIQGGSKTQVVTVTFPSQAYTQGTWYAQTMSFAAGFSSAPALFPVGNDSNSQGDVYFTNVSTSGATMNYRPDGSFTAAPSFKVLAIGG